MKYVDHREKQSDQGSDGDVDGEEAFVLGENRWFGVGREGRKSDLGDEEHVEEGDEYEGEVLDADHAGGGEDDDKGEGVELVEGEEALPATEGWFLLVC